MIVEIITGVNYKLTLVMKTVEYVELKEENNHKNNKWDLIVLVQTKNQLHKINFSDDRGRAISCYDKINSALQIIYQQKQKNK